MTELMAGFAVQPEGARLAYREQPGDLPVCIGAVFRIVDPATGKTVQQGAVGELEVKTPNRMRGYLDDEAATTAAITADGYFRTGDLGWIRADGAVVFESRVDDAMRVGAIWSVPPKSRRFCIRIRP
ncbi:long-chain fatty acid--CoA ligase [Pandoraea terrae]|uniref:Long-chain fatty acid--CoA ligase n=1 Tax=Pandoraea terrae TaxID=1537710 RepID=A0A5E4UWL7_9BURK|nr:AMP-binding protein [Pandoraea terrae]VVE03489.1 long-chain fatty acid--CoA ligase [Pandoraea terrae]